MPRHKDVYVLQANVLPIIEFRSSRHVYYIILDWFYQLVFRAFLALLAIISLLHLLAQVLASLLVYKTPQGLQTLPQVDVCLKAKENINNHLLKYGWIHELSLQSLLIYQISFIEVGTFKSK